MFVLAGGGSSVGGRISGDGKGWVCFDEMRISWLQGIELNRIEWLWEKELEKQR